MEVVELANGLADWEVICLFILVATQTSRTAMCPFGHEICFQERRVLACG